MPYAEAFTQRLILSYFLVEFLNTLNESVECFICKAILIIDKSFRIKAWFHIEKAESTS